MAYERRTSKDNNFKVHTNDIYIKGYVKTSANNLKPWLCSNQLQQYQCEQTDLNLFI